MITTEEVQVVLSIIVVTVLDLQKIGNVPVELSLSFVISKAVPLQPSWDPLFSIVVTDTPLRLHEISPTIGHSSIPPGCTTGSGRLQDERLWKVL